jgi:hypothetical protein
MKKYDIRLTPEERESLVAFTREGKASARRIKRASILMATEWRSTVDARRRVPHLYPETL